MSLDSPILEAAPNLRSYSLESEAGIPNFGMYSSKQALSNVFTTQAVHCSFREYWRSSFSFISGFDIWWSGHHCSFGFTTQFNITMYLCMDIMLIVAYWMKYEEKNFFFPENYSIRLQDFTLYLETEKWQFQPLLRLSATGKERWLTTECGQLLNTLEENFTVRTDALLGIKKKNKLIKNTWMCDSISAQLEVSVKYSADWFPWGWNFMLCMQECH